MSADWKEMTGEERYRVVELARRGTKSLKEICETFGVSRQTLHRALEKVEQAAKAALEPKRPGRKGKSEEEQRIIEISKKQSSLEQEVDNWKTRYEVAQAYIEITRDAVEAQEREDRKTERNRRKRERQKKKRRAPAAAGKQPGATGEAGKRPRLAVVDDGAGAGDHDVEPEAVDEEA
jgi:transposase